MPRSGSNPASATVDKWLVLMGHGKKPRGEVVAQANGAKVRLAVTVFKIEQPALLYSQITPGSIDDAKWSGNEGNEE